MTTTRLLLQALCLAFVACSRQTSVDETGDTGDTGETADTGTESGCDSFADACPLSFDEQGAALVSNAISQAGDRDFYEISATAGDYYAIHARSHSGERGDPDTVIRLFDENQNLLGENDDQPFLMFGFDAGYIFRATSDASYYVEVLEWSDWAAESTGADGDASWGYDLVVHDMPIGELVADNDAISDARIALDTLKDGDPANNELFWYSDPWAGDYSFAVGDISSGTDVDLFGTWADNSDGGNYTGEVCLWGFYPDIPTEMTPALSLYTADGTQVAHTEAAELTAHSYKVFYDAGITFPIDKNGGDYFLEVSDKNGGSGIGYWYALMNVCYPATFVDPPHPNYVQVSMETEGVENTVAMHQGATSVFGRFAGFMNDIGGADTDIFAIAEGISTGDTLSLWMDAVDAGSALTDTRATVLDADGLTVLGSTTGANPLIGALDISGTSGPIFIEVTSESGLTGDDVYYLGRVLVE